MCVIFKYRVIFIYRHLLTIYYMKEHLLLLTYFVVAKVVYVLKKGKLGVGIFVTRQTFLVTLVCGFEIRNGSTVIGGF